MNRNRFSAVATISVPTLGIKGKKISEKERYIETIDPAPSTPAGEPLGEIEMEVSEGLAQRLKKGWPVEVVRTETGAPLLLETTHPEKLENVRKISSSEAPSSKTGTTTNTCKPLEEETFETPLPAPRAPRAVSHPPVLLLEMIGETGDTEGGSSITVGEKEKRRTPPQPSPARIKASLPETPKETLASPPKEIAAIQSRTPNVATKRNLTDVSNQTEGETTGNPPDREPVEPAPSLFRSRSFAALIDISVACSFFVLGLLLFPDPPRIIPFVLGALYLLTKDSLGILNGQSIGKKIMRLRAVNKRQRTLAGNYKTGFLRNLSWFLAPVEFAILYVREDEKNKGKRLGDDWASTEVIVEERPRPRKSKWLP